MTTDELKDLLNAWKDIDWPSPQHRKDQLDYIIDQYRPDPEAARRAVDDVIKWAQQWEYEVHNSPESDRASEHLKKAKSTLLAMLGVTG